MVIISLGGNLSGPHGPPLQTLNWAIEQMAGYQISVLAVSPFYSTEPVGQIGQNNYLNGIVCVYTSLSARNLLKNLKQIEKKAGRDNRQLCISGRWGARPLDLDIIDYKGMVTGNYPLCAGNGRATGCAKMRRCELILPHPQAHLRPFVIAPIIDIDPFWHHPVRGLSALSIWASMRNCTKGRILHRVG